MSLSFFNSVSLLRRGWQILVVYIHSITWVIIYMSVLDLVYLLDHNLYTVQNCSKSNLECQTGFVQDSVYEPFWEWNRNVLVIFFKQQQIQQMTQFLSDITFKYEQTWNNYFCTRLQQLKKYLSLLFSLCWRNKWITSFFYKKIHRMSQIHIWYCTSFWHWLVPVLNYAISISSFNQ